MDNLEKNKTYNMREVVFLYLKEKCHRKDYEGITYDQISQKVDSNLRASFDESCNTFSSNFRDLLTILKIKDEIESCKKQNGGYSFDEEDKDFLCELMFRYTLKKSEREIVENEKKDTSTKIDKQVQVWKAIRGIDNERYNGFIDIYIFKTGRALIDEVEFIINGFLGIYKKKANEESVRYGDFDRHLKASTQYVRLKWLRETDDILSSALPLSWEEIEATNGEELILEHQSRLEYLIQLIHVIVQIENQLWEDKKLQRIEETLEKNKLWAEWLIGDKEIEEKFGIKYPSRKVPMEPEKIEKSRKLLKRLKKKEYNQECQNVKNIIKELPPEMQGLLANLYENSKPTEYAEITRRMSEEIVKMNF